MKGRKFIKMLLIYLLNKIHMFQIIVCLCLLSCAGKINAPSTSEFTLPDTSVIEKLQGEWIEKDNKWSGFKIEKDSITYFFEEEAPERYVLTISEKVIYRSDTIKAPEHQYLFKINDATTEELFYLLGFNEQELSLMAYSNGQTVVYIRKKRKSTKG